MRLRRLTYFALLAGFGITSVPLFAHHGTGVAYETDKTVTLTGTVTEWIRERQPPLAEHEKVNRES